MEDMQKEIQSTDTCANNSDFIDLKCCLEIKTNKIRLWLSFAIGAVLDMSHEF